MNACKIIWKNPIKSDGKEITYELDYFDKDIQELIRRESNLWNEQEDLDERLGLVFCSIIKHPAFDKKTCHKPEPSGESCCSWYCIAYSYGYIPNSNEYAAPPKEMITRYQNILNAIRKVKHGRENIQKELCHRLEETMGRELEGYYRSYNGKTYIRFY